MSAAPSILTGDVIPSSGKELQTNAADMTAHAQEIVDKIHEEHRLAQVSYAEHAVICGQLLLEQRKRVPHGDFGPWLAANCRFARSTATRYMRAARLFATGVAISSMTSVFPSGRQKREALPAPADVQASALDPAAPPSVAAALGDELSIEQAAAILEDASTADSRRRLKELARTGRLVKQSRRRLERAEIAQRNAVASILAAARKLREAHG